MGLGGSTVRMHHAREMKNLIYSASLTRQADQRKGVNLARKGVEISIPYFWALTFNDSKPALNLPYLNNVDK